MLGQSKLDGNLKKNENEKTLKTQCFQGFLLGEPSEIRTPDNLIKSYI